MGTLSTHVLDTMQGIPAAGVAVALAGPHGLFAQGVTNADGRVPDLLPKEHGDLPLGHYRLTFGVAAYFRALGVDLPQPPFLDEVSVDFGIYDSTHYHVPLLVSPFSYSTYRGS